MMVSATARPILIFGQKKSFLRPVITQFIHRILSPRECNKSCEKARSEILLWRFLWVVPRKLPSLGHPPLSATQPGIIGHDVQPSFQIGVPVPEPIGSGICPSGISQTTIPHRPPTHRPVPYNWHKPPLPHARDGASFLPRRGFSSQPSPEVEHPRGFTSRGLPQKKVPSTKSVRSRRR